MGSNEQNVMSSTREFIPATIILLCLAAQLALTFTRWRNFYDIDGLYYTGFVIWGFSAILGVLPVIEFRRKGKVAKGSSYMKTTFLVKSGIFSIVRHPQFLAGIFVSFALVLMSQFWAVILLLLPVIFFTYLDSRKANEKLIRKFGDQYMEYMEEVPGLNPMTGIVKLIIRNTKQ